MHNLFLVFRKIKFHFLLKIIKNLSIFPILTLKKIIIITIMEKFFKVIVLFLYLIRKSKSEEECKLKSVHIV
jgi:hypothetical protein